MVGSNQFGFQFLTKKPKAYFALGSFTKESLSEWTKI